MFVIFRLNYIYNDSEQGKHDLTAVWMDHGPWVFHKLSPNCCNQSMNFILSTNLIVGLSSQSKFTPTKSRSRCVKAFKALWLDSPSANPPPATTEAKMKTRWDIVLAIVLLISKNWENRVDGKHFYWVGYAFWKKFYNSKHDKGVLLPWMTTVISICFVRILRCNQT